MKSRVLLYMAELFESSVAVAALVWLLTSMDPDMLHQLMITRE